MIACMLAKGHGAERTVALIQKGGYREVYDFLEGVDQAISPRALCAAHILRYVRAGSPRAISVIGQGAAEVLELQTTIKDAIKVKKMGLPKGAVVGAIVHEESVSIATGDSVVRPGDTLIVFTVVEALEEVERVLRPGALTGPHVRLLRPRIARRGPRPVNIRAVLRMLGIVMILMGAFMLVPALVGLGYDQHHSARACMYAALTSMGLGAIPAVLFHGSTKDEGPDRLLQARGPRDGRALVARRRRGGRAPVSLRGDLHLVRGRLLRVGVGPDHDGFHRHVGEGIDSMPHAIAFWRSFSQWIGGFGIVMVFVVLFPTGRSLFRSEVPGVSREAGHQRVRDSALMLVKIYMALSLLLVAGLLLVGMPTFDAVIHTFSTIANGGFSNHSESIAYFGSAAVEGVLVVFMLLSAFNFAIYDTLIRVGPRPALRRLVGSLEARMFIGIVMAATLSIAGRPVDLGRARAPRTTTSRCRGAARQPLPGHLHHHHGGIRHRGLRLSGPSSVAILLMLLAFCGACAGSTSGGLKLVRIAIVLKAALVGVRRFARPRVIHHVRVDGQTLDGRITSSVTGYLVLWVLVFTLRHDARRELRHRPRDERDGGRGDPEQRRSGAGRRRARGELRGAPGAPEAGAEPLHGARPPRVLRARRAADARLLAPLISPERENAAAPRCGGAGRRSVSRARWRDQEDVLAVDEGLLAQVVAPVGHEAPELGRPGHRQVALDRVAVPLELDLADDEAHELVAVLGEGAEHAGAHLVGVVREARGDLEQQPEDAGVGLHAGRGGPAGPVLAAHQLEGLAVARLVEGDRDRGEDDVGLGGERLVGDGLDDRAFDGRPVTEPGLDLDLAALGGGAGEDDAALGRDPELHAVPGGDDHDGVDELAAPRAGGQE